MTNQKQMETAVSKLHTGKPYMRLMVTICAMCVSICADTNEINLHAVPIAVPDPIGQTAPSLELIQEDPVFKAFQFGAMPELEHTNHAATPYLLDSDSGAYVPRFFRGVFRQDGTNICEMDLVTNVVTQWMPIEQANGDAFNRVKQVGVLVTNQVLTVFAYGKTNEVILKMLGREEWPSQKRTIMVPNRRPQNH